MLTHPFDPETLYQLTEDGNIRVSKGTSHGIFTDQGKHLSGDIREADPQLCVWVGNNPEPEEQLSTIIAGDPEMVQDRED